MPTNTNCKKWSFKAWLNLVFMVNNGEMVMMMRLLKLNSIRGVGLKDLRDSLILAVSLVHQVLKIKLNIKTHSKSINKIKSTDQLLKLKKCDRTP